MNPLLVGRKKEIDALEDALETSKPEFIAIVGRRRVGKTYLIKETYKNKIDFELTGSEDFKKSEQLQAFVYAMHDYFPNYELKAKPKSWLKAFRELSLALKSQDKKGKVVVFLDELPWLGSRKSGFLEGLSWFWNSWGINQNIVLVVCGSAASWMIKRVIQNKGGLHNRVTRIISLFPFTLGETEEFLKAKKIHLNRYQITQLYQAMGGIPTYLEQIQPGLSAIQNIQEVCFRASGYLHSEFTRLYASLFTNHQNHIEIIKALASKWVGMTRSEIIKKTRFKNGGMLTQIIRELEQSGFVTRYSGYGKKKRQSLYRLADPYSMFYLTFMEPLGSNSMVDFTKLSDLQNYKSWSGYAFENICLQHTSQIRKALGISGIHTQISSFIARPKDGLPGAQIDLVIDRGDQSINLCEIKYSTSEYVVTKKDVTKLETHKQVFRYHTKSKKHFFTTLITTFGAIKNQHRLNHIDQVVTLEDLFS